MPKVALAVAEDTMRAIGVALPRSVFESYGLNLGVLPRLLSRSLHELIVIELTNADRADTSAIIREVRSRSPQSHILVFARMHPGISDKISAACHAGADLFVLQDPQELVEKIQQIVSGVEERSAIRRVTRRLLPIVPQRLCRAVAYCLAHAARPTSTSDLAIALGISRRTLLNRFCREGWPPPSAVINWTKLLIAAALLQESSRTVGEVAREVGLQSATSLRLTLRRYAGCSPAKVRREGAELVMQAFGTSLPAAAQIALHRPARPISSNDAGALTHD